MTTSSSEDSHCDGDSRAGTSWSPEASKAAREIRLETRSILLVEDSPDNQNLFRRILTTAGAHVTIAVNGLEGVDISMTREFDVIIMDIRMPILDGYEASRRIRANGYLGPIIALTAHATPGEEQRCRGAGCSHFQLKPIDRSGLLRSVSDALLGEKSQGASTS